MDIITLKCSNGHLIKVIKGVREGYKYIGLYSKPIKSKEVKQQCQTQ